MYFIYLSEFIIRNVKYIICENLEKRIRAIHYKLSEQQAKVVPKTKLAKVLAAKSCDMHNNYLIIQLYDISSMSNIFNLLIIQLFGISSMSDVFNYLIIQPSDTSSMFNIFNHLIIHLSDVSDV